VRSSLTLYEHWTPDLVGAERRPSNAVVWRRISEHDGASVTLYRFSIFDAIWYCTDCALNDAAFRNASAWKEGAILNGAYLNDAQSEADN